MEGNGFKLNEFYFLNISVKRLLLEMLEFWRALRIAFNKSELLLRLLFIIIWLFLLVLMKSLQGFFNAFLKSLFKLLLGFHSFLNSL